MRFVYLLLLFIIAGGTAILIARESYEDYRNDREKYYNEENGDRKTRRERKTDREPRRDKPLSEVKTSDREELLDELRGTVRDEIDQSMNRERKAGERNIDEDRLLREVKKIVREEIQDAIKIKEKKYLAKGVIEAGGFISMQTTGLEGNASDNNLRMKIYPMVNYFLGTNVAASLKAEAEFNLTTNTQNYFAGIGPLFVFGITRMDTICFYTGIYVGISMNSEVSNGFGYRFGNEIGLKFIMTTGVILNAGVMLVFDNAGSIKGFQNIIIPTVGITAYF